MQHDIYSLGVCLLEIDLWKSVLDCKKDRDVRFSTLLTKEKRGGGLVQGTIENQLVWLSLDRLKARMGHKYSKLVETCLTCLDPENTDFGDLREFQDEDGVEVGQRSVKKIIDMMNAISI